MMRKKASRLFGHRQPEDVSRPHSQPFNPLRFPSSTPGWASPTLTRDKPRSKQAPPRTLVMSTADIWEREEEQEEHHFAAPRLSLDPCIEDRYEGEPLFEESFLETWSHNADDMMSPINFSRRLSQLQNEVAYYDDDSDLSDSDYEDCLDEFLDEDFPPQPMLAVSISVMHVGRPKMIDVSPQLAPMSFGRPSLHNRYGSVSSHGSSDESDSYGPSTFSQHSSASSVSDWTRSPTSPTSKLSRSSSDYTKTQGPPIPVPPRSAKRGSMASSSKRHSVDDDSDASSDHGSSSSSTYNYADYDWNFLHSQAERTMRMIQAIGEDV